MKSYQVPGLSKPVYMPTDVPVHIDIVPASVRNVRSNTKRAASAVTKYTDHETANFKLGATARMHRNWLHSGPRDQNGDLVYVGFNSVNDDRELFVLCPYDEKTWAAGTATGNHISDHSERCVNAGINHTRAREISAAWAAGVIHARGLTVAGALVQHNVWYGKNCPLLVRRDGLWPSYVNMVEAAYRRIVAYLAGTPIPNPLAIEIGATVKTTAALNLRESPSTTAKIITTLPVNTEATVVDGPANRDGYRWWRITTGNHNGVVADDWLMVTAPPKPAEPAPAPKDGWPYPNPVAPAFWDELMSTTAPYVKDAGTLWYRTNALYRVKTRTKRQQFAVGDDRVVGPDLVPGMVFRGEVTGQSPTDKEAYVVTSGLTRVRLDALEFVEEADESGPDAA